MRLITALFGAGTLLSVAFTAELVLRALTDSVTGTYHSLHPLAFVLAIVLGWASPPAPYGDRVSSHTNNRRKQ